jgi:hypothetical protein
MERLANFGVPKVERQRPLFVISGSGQVSPDPVGGKRFRQFCE